MKRFTLTVVSILAVVAACGVAFGQYAPPPGGPSFLGLPGYIVKSIEAGRGNFTNLTVNDAQVLTNLPPGTLTNAAAFDPAGAATSAAATVQTNLNTASNALNAAITGETARATNAEATKVSTNAGPYLNLLTNTATLSQGAKADAALPKTGGVMTGYINLQYQNLDFGDFGDQWIIGIAGGQLTFKDYNAGSVWTLPHSQGSNTFASIADFAGAFPNASGVAVSNLLAGVVGTQVVDHAQIARAITNGQSGFTVATNGPFLNLVRPTASTEAIAVSGSLSGSNLFSHAYKDQTAFSSLDTGAYASFDSIPVMSGNIAWNHFYSYQSRLDFEGPGTLSDMSSFVSYNSVNSPVIHHWMFRGFDPQGTGSIIDNYGFYVPQLSRGTNNYAFYAAGSTPSYFGGTITVGSNVIATGTGTFPGGIEIATTGAKLGAGAQAGTYGVGIGNGADGQNFGVAIGYTAHAAVSGVGVGGIANGENAGIAVGWGAWGVGNGDVAATPIAIGSFAYAAGSNAVAIGNYCTNTTPNTLRYNGSVLIGSNLTVQGSLSVSNGVTLGSLLNLKNYTVTNLPAGTRGDICYVTDALLPSFLTTVAGGGSVVTPVFFDGATWKSF